MDQTETDEAQTGAPGVEASLTRHGGLTYLEIPAIEPARSAAFYETVFGWEAERRDTDDYRFRDATGHLIGRWVAGLQINVDPGFLPYMYVDRIDVAIDRAIAAGGEVVRPTYAEGELWVATVRDPAGNVIGVWQAGPR